MKPERKSSGSAGQRTKEGETDSGSAGQRTKEGETDNNVFDLSSIKVAVNDVGTKTKARKSIEKRMKRIAKSFSDETIRYLSEYRRINEEYEKFVLDLKAQGMTIPYY
ncbi:hypothetical protein ISN45_Aa01g000230 [Arabidopsis thaliana x Arabidopsis arenosa]|uniref:Uncharacterized protein n=1 Tax=Arabidopsis thaliana x Arabidopsis arenosa TaxID=1240361 RepID=A0A8T2BTF3_9BRAS|nr:hypothetical protein ISN45_Aa01g000230 [Arabidopsis thaliana x Arabidopsis arenosa]